MSKIKMISLLLSTAILGSGSVLTYLSIEESRNVDGVQSLATSKVRTNRDGATRIPGPLYATANEDGSFKTPSGRDTNGLLPRIVTGAESGTRSNFNLDSLDDYILKLASDFANGPSDEQMIIVPANYWSGTPQREVFDKKPVTLGGVYVPVKSTVYGSDYSSTGEASGSLTYSLRYKEENWRSSNYLLKNALVFSIPSHVNSDGRETNPNTRLAAAFANHMRSSTKSIATLNAESRYYDKVQSTLYNGDNCSLFEAASQSTNKYEALMGKLYNKINCENNGTESLNFSSILSRFFETNQREVYVSDTLTLETFEGLPVITTAKARQLTDKEVFPNRKMTVGVDIIKWLETLTLGGTSEFTTIFERVRNKIAYDGTKSTLEVLDDVFDASTDISDDSKRSIIAILTTLIEGTSELVETEFHSPKLFGGVDKDFLVDKDIFETIALSGESSIQKLIQDVMFGNEEYNKFFVSKGADSLINEFQKEVSVLNKELVSLGNEDFASQIQSKLNELQTLNNENSNLDNLISTFYDAAQLSRINTDRTKLLDLSAKVRNLESQINYINNRISLLKSNERETQLTPLQEQITSINNTIATLKQEITSIENHLKTYDDNVNVQRQNVVVKNIRSLEEEIVVLKTKRDKRATSKRNINSKLIVLNRQINHLKNMKNSNNVNEYTKGIQMADIIPISTGLIRSSVVKLLSTLNLASVDSNGKVNFKDLYFSFDNLDDLKPLFHNKDAINGVNKVIDFFNSIVGRFPEDATEAATKLLFNTIPEEALDLLNLEFNLLGQQFRFSEGIDIGTDITYGLITGVSTIAGLGVGAGVGAVVGGLAGGKGGARIGALAGAGIGTLAGVSVGAGTASHYFADGNLHINKPNKLLSDLFKKLQKTSTKSKGALEDSYFNFFTDGHTLVKELYMEDLNKVFVNLSKTFLYEDDRTKTDKQKEAILFNQIKNTRTFTNDKNFQAWNMVAETFKTFMISPKTILASMETKSYTTNSKGQLFSSEAIDKIKKDTTYSKELIKKMSGITNQNDIDTLYDLHIKTRDWLLKYSLLTKEEPSVDFGEGDYRIGFNPKDVSRATVERFVNEFKKDSGLQNNIILVEYTDEQEKIKMIDGYGSHENLIGFFDFNQIDRSFHDFLSLTNDQQQEVMLKGRTNVESSPSIPLFSANNNTTRVPLATITYIGIASVRSVGAGKPFPEGNYPDTTDNKDRYYTFNTLHRITGNN